MMKIKGIHLTKLECIAATQALDNFLGSASWKEAVDFFGSVQDARAAVRANQKIGEYYVQHLRECRRKAGIKADFEKRREAES